MFTLCIRRTVLISEIVLKMTWVFFLILLNTIPFENLYYSHATLCGLKKDKNICLCTLAHKEFLVELVLYNLFSF